MIGSDFAALLRRPKLFIVHGGTDEEDRKLAASIAQQAADFAEPLAVTPDELRRDYAWRVYPGITLLILSPAAAGDAAARRSLVHLLLRAHRQRLLPHYCVCRGASAAQFMQYPELNPLFENVTVADADKVPAILSDMRDHVARLPNAPQVKSPWLLYKEGLEVWVSLLGTYLTMPQRLLSRLSLLAAALLALGLWIGWSPPAPTVLIALCAFMAGVELNYLHPLDLWPFLGRNARALPPDELRKKAGEVIGTALVTDAMKAAGAAARLVPAVLSAQQSGPSSWVWIAAAAGFLWPTLIRGLMNRGLASYHAAMGLTAPHASASTAVVQGAVPPLVLKGMAPDERSAIAAFAPDEQRRAANWLLANRKVLGRYALRPWTAAPDYAFISYAWRDDPDVGAASRVADACKSAGIECFLDKSNLASLQGLFRPPVAAAVARCTHFFLVISANVGAARVVGREIDMAMTRWILEMLPPIVCVAEPGVAERVRADPQTPFRLRFLLTFCPAMTPAEAADPARLRSMVEFTRREGKLRDWMILLSPGSVFSRAARVSG